MGHELTTDNQLVSTRSNLATDATFSNVGADRRSRRRSADGGDETLEFFAELTRSRDWKITRADYRFMSLDEMQWRAWGIFWCLVLMVLVCMWAWQGEFTKWLGLGP